MGQGLRASGHRGLGAWFGLSESSDSGHELVGFLDDGKCNIFDGSWCGMKSIHFMSLNIVCC